MYIKQRHDGGWTARPILPGGQRTAVPGRAAPHAGAEILRNAAMATAAAAWSAMPIAVVAGAARQCGGVVLKRWPLRPRLSGPSR